MPAPGPTPLIRDRITPPHKPIPEHHFSPLSLTLSWEASQQGHISPYVSPKSSSLIQMSRRTFSHRNILYHRISVSVFPTAFYTNLQFCWQTPRISQRGPVSPSSFVRLSNH